MESDSISIIDTQSKTRIGDIPTGKGPVRIGVAHDGKMPVYALQTGEAVGFANAETRKGRDTGETDRAARLAHLFER